MNTDEAKPEGVWFRNSARTADTDQITDLGVHRNEQVELVCYAWGDAVRPHGDRLWYSVRNVSRPTVGDKLNQGYLNAHYIDDGRTANHVDPRVRICGHSVFYSGTDLAEGVAGTVVADKNLKLADWAPGNCATNDAANKPLDATTVLAGWSRGRLGTVYFLAGASATRKAGVHTIVLFDPGALSDMTHHWWAFWQTDCDQRLHAAVLFADWLNSDDRNRLFILAGKDTENASGADDRPTFAGIKQYYLSAMHGTASADRALVCVYHDLGHPDVLTKFAAFVQRPTLDCPTATGAPAPTSWHP
jgi:hypothetical protein